MSTAETEEEFDFSSANEKVNPRKRLRGRRGCHNIGPKGSQIRNTSMSMYNNHYGIENHIVEKQINEEYDEEKYGSNIEIDDGGMELKKKERTNYFFSSYGSEKRPKFYFSSNRYSLNKKKRWKIIENLKKNQGYSNKINPTKINDAKQYKNKKSHLSLQDQSEIYNDLRRQKCNFESYEDFTKRVYHKERKNESWRDRKKRIKKEEKKRKKKRKELYFQKSIHSKFPRELRRRKIEKRLQMKKTIPPDIKRINNSPKMTTKNIRNKKSKKKIRNLLKQRRKEERKNQKKNNEREELKEIIFSNKFFYFFESDNNSFYESLKSFHLKKERYGERRKRSYHEKRRKGITNEISNQLIQPRKGMK